MKKSCSSDFAIKTDLANLKSNVDKLDIFKFKNEPSGLNSLKLKYAIIISCNLVKKNTKINKIEKKITDHNHDEYDKYITTEEFNKLTSKNLDARLAQANLTRKNDIADFVKKTDFDDKLKNLNKKVTSNKTKI